MTRKLRHLQGILTTGPMDNWTGTAEQTLEGVEAAVGVPDPHEVNNEVLDVLSGIMGRPMTEREARRLRNAWRANHG